MINRYRIIHEKREEENDTILKDAWGEISSEEFTREELITILTMTIQYEIITKKLSLILLI